MKPDLMNSSKLDMKRKLSFGEDDVGFKKKTTKETNLLNSFTKEYRENQIQVDVTGLDIINGNTEFTTIQIQQTTISIFVFKIT